MKNKNQVFIDMDGTISDFYKRFTTCYNIIVQQMNLDNMVMTEEQFRAKRQSGEHLFDFNRPDFKTFAEKFDSIVETEAMLELDTIIPGMRRVIKDLYYKDYDLCVVSYRANRSRLINQLYRLGVGEYVSTICMPFDKNHRPGKKADLIKEYSYNPTGYIIGDDVYEIAAGKELGLSTITVTWGSRNFDTLKSHNPDNIVERPEQILEIIR